MMARVSPESAAEFIEYIPNEPAGDLLGELSPEIAASIVSEMDSDDQADVLAELEEEDLREILHCMDEREAGEARQLLAYDEDVAGGLMMTEYFSYPRAFRAGAVLQDLAQREEEYELHNVHYIYVTDRGRKLTGVARIRDIVFAPPAARLSEIVREAVTVRDTTPLDELETLFDESSLTALPVVDDENRMLGVVRRRAVYDAVAERADAEHMKSQGFVGGEELRSTRDCVRGR